MALEKLKSIFSDVQPMKQSDLSKSTISEIQPMKQSDLTKSPTQKDNNFAQSDLSKSPTQIDKEFNRTDLSKSPTQIDKEFNRTDLSKTETQFDNDFKKTDLSRLSSVFQNIVKPMAKTDLTTSPTQIDTDFKQTDLTKSPTQIDTDFKQTDLTKSPTQIDTDFTQSDLTKLPGLFDDDFEQTDLTTFKRPLLGVFEKTSLLEFNSQFNAKVPGPVNFIKKGQYGNKIPDGFTLNMGNTLMLGGDTTLHGVGGGSLFGPVDFITLGQYGNEIPKGFTLNFDKTLYKGVQTTLHSVDGFKLDTSPYLKFKSFNDFPTPIIENRPTPNNYSIAGGIISATNFESSLGLALENYNGITYDGRVGRVEFKKFIYTTNPYSGTRFDDGLGGLFNQTQKYFGEGSPEPNPTRSQIIEGGNLTSNPPGGGYQSKLAGKLIFDAGNPSLEKYQNGNNVGSTWFKDGVNTLPYLTSPGGDSYPTFNPLTRGMNGVDGGLNTRTIQVDLDGLIGNTLSSTGGWESLYNKDHTAKDDVGYNYPNVDRSQLNMRYDISKNSPIYVPGFNRQGPGGESGREPYHISDIGAHANEFDRAPGRELPAPRSLVDLKRLGKYYFSASGGASLIIENLRTMIANAGKWYQGGVEKDMRPVMRFNKAYGQALSGLPAALRPIGYATPIFLMDRGFPIDTFSFNNSTYHNFLNKNSDGNNFPLSKNSVKVDKKTYADSFLVTSTDNVRTSIQGTAHSSGKFKTGDGTADGSGWFGNVEVRGDKMTLAPIAVQPNWPNQASQNKGAQSAVNAVTSDIDIESETNGMPFYFKNMINGEYIIFRGYLDGLTENIVPTWEEEGYIGRSEPVYTYSRTTRDLAFNLQVYAQSPNELEMIMIKLNKLNALCYPSYGNDSNLNYLVGENTLEKTRMIAPLIKLRMGEWLGSAYGDGQLGFIRSLNYTIPETATWETTQGKRVPKQFTIAVTFQAVANDGVYSQENGSRPTTSDNRFYGYNFDIKEGGVRPFTLLPTDKNVRV